MNLRWFHVREFQSVRDSGRVTVGDIACLVGKNEAGKTALLRALYKLNPIVAAEGDFDVTRDYPRMEVEDYRIAVEAGRRSHAVPIEACYSIEGEELQAISKLFGAKCLKKPEFTLSKSYENKRTFDLEVDEASALSYLIESADLIAEMREALKACPITAKDLCALLQAQEQTEEVKRLVGLLEKITKRRVNGYIFDTLLAKKERSFCILTNIIK